MHEFQVRDTRETVKEMTLAGHTVREIAEACDISTQRVYQHLKQLGINSAKRPPT